MPSGVKMSQANRFNDPEDKCKILVATDAVGMGLNLNIRRMIFYSLIKPQMIDSSKRENDLQDHNRIFTNRYSDTDKNTKLDYISTSQALQIAGRAGR